MEKIHNSKIIMDFCEENGHILMNSDVFDGLHLIPDGSVDLIFIDPPII
jgi:DNA modification methylase